MPPKRCPNRLLVLCASINDVTAWPFWKFLQMKKIRGVTDMALLAFNSDGGSFEARIDGDRYQMKNYAKVRGYQHDMFEGFINRWHDPGRSYFVYGGHGMGDFIELEQGRVSLQVHELANIFGSRSFEAILFDACFMANLDCAYHLRHNTRYIGACEGYMWEPDTALDYHVFNTHNASAMSRYKDPLHILRVIQADYCSRAARGDFTIINTTRVAELRHYVQEHVMPRVYDRAALYNVPQQERLRQIAEASLQAAVAEFGHPGGEVSVPDGVGGGVGRPRTAPAFPDALAFSALGRLTRRQRVLQAIQFENALYPSEAEDKQLVDLKSYLTDMLEEEQQRKAWEAVALGPPRRTAAGRRRLRSDMLLRGGEASSVSSAASSSFAVWRPPPSRALFVDRHGRLPPAASAAPATPEGGTVTAAAPTCSVPPITTSVPERLSTTSPYYKGSAQEGLDLFHEVVVSHVPPKAASLYASHLGGLSLAVHEYSSMSRPREPWPIPSKKILKRRIKEFLKTGELAEVVMDSTAVEGAAKNTLHFGAPNSTASTVCTASLAPSPSLTASLAVGDRSQQRLDSPSHSRSHSSSSSSVKQANGRAVSSST